MSYTEVLDYTVTKVYCTTMVLRIAVHDYTDVSLETVVHYTVVVLQTVAHDCTVAAAQCYTTVVV
jgi:hypothetical protein